MRSYKIFSWAIALFAVFALASNAFAANQVVVSVTSEPIQSGTDCGKAGNWSLEFDAATVLADGDAITADLPYIDVNGDGSLIRRATLCSDIDIVLARGADYTAANVADMGTAWDPNVTVLPIVAGASPVYEILDPIDAVAPAASNSTSGGVFFHITGTTGSQRVNVDVVGDFAGNGTLIVGDEAGDKLVVQFLNQILNNDYAADAAYVGADGVYADITTTGVYADNAVIDDNTYCINIGSANNWNSNLINASIDSAKFTFNPSVEVAHTVPPEAYGLLACSKIDTGLIEIGLVGGQSGVDSCETFDNESSKGFCTKNLNAENYLMVQRTDNVLDAANYQVQLDILVNGATGANGVYFTDDALTVVADTASTVTLAGNICKAGVGSGTAGAAVAFTDAGGTLTFTNASGTVQTGAALGAIVAAGGAVDSCTTGLGTAVTAKTDAHGMNANGSGHNMLWMNIPQMNYDTDVIADDDVVAVRVTLLLAPCGVLFTGDFQVGTFGCPVAGVSNMLTFPYMSAMAAGADGYDDGVVVTNLTAAAGSATFTFYEMDGDISSITVPVPANGMYVNLLSAMVSGLSLDTSVEGTAGNSRVWFTVTTDFAVDGFAFLYDTTNGTSMGYLPRL